MGGIHATVGEDDIVHPVVHRRFGFSAQVVQGFLQGGFSAGCLKCDRELHGVEAFIPDVAEDVQLRVGQHGMGQAHHLAVRLAGLQDVHAHGPDIFGERHDQFLADGVDGRVRHLGELLPEVVEQQLRLVRQHGQRRVVSHGGRGFRPVCGHGHEGAFDVLAGVAEGAEPPAVVRHAVFRFPSAPQGVQLDAVGGQPLAVGLGGGQLLLQLAIVIDAAFLRVHQQDLARLEPSFFLDVARLEGDDPRFAGHDHHVVFRDEVAGRTEAVAVEHPAGIAPVAEQQGGRPVPWLHQDGVVFVERLQVFADGVLVVERFRDEHGHGVRQAQSGHDEELQRVVQ